MACDICGKTGICLEDLRDVYQTDDIKQICPDCSKNVTDHLRKLQKMAHKLNENWLKRFMRNMKNKDFA